MRDDIMRIRELKTEESDVLKDFTYEAIFIPEGVEPPDRSIVELPELKVYYEDFGKGKDDCCLVAEDDSTEGAGEIAGAVWTRVMDDYGHVDDDTPSLAISLYENHRGKGIGTQLLNDMLCTLKEKGYKRVSLSVQKENYAVRMYQHAGFNIVDENEEEYIMICVL